MPGVVAVDQCRRPASERLTVSPQRLRHRVAELRDPAGEVLAPPLDDIQ
jgi:hypothetical protein